MVAEQACIEVRGDERTARVILFSHPGLDGGDVKVGTARGALERGDGV
ncbi:MAG: hypothetical protein ACM3X3_09700 [Betaproteobacteria bacterium]